MQKLSTARNQQNFPNPQVFKNDIIVFRFFKIFTDFRIVVAFNCLPENCSGKIFFLVLKKPELLSIYLLFSFGEKRVVVDFEIHSPFTFIVK